MVSISEAIVSALRVAPTFEGVPEDRLAPYDRRRQAKRWSELLRTLIEQGIGLTCLLQRETVSDEMPWPDVLQHVPGVGRVVDLVEDLGVGVAEVVGGRVRQVLHLAHDVVPQVADQPPGQRRQTGQPGRPQAAGQRPDGGQRVLGADDGEVDPLVFGQPRRP